jgi:hypothetical protein
MLQDGELFTVVIDYIFSKLERLSMLVTSNPWPIFVDKARAYPREVITWLRVGS